MKLVKFNKRGDIPTTILVIGVIFVCGMAIFSFFASTIKMRDSFVGISLMEKMKFQIEEKIFNNENPMGLSLDKNETRGLLWDRKEVLVFSVEYQGNP